MKKKVINNLIILEFAIFISIIFIAINIVLFTNYFDDAVPNSKAGMLEATKNTGLYTAQKEYKIEEKQIDKQKIKTANKPKQASKDTLNYFSDFNIAPTKKIDEGTKKEVKKKKERSRKLSKATAYYLMNNSNETNEYILKKDDGVETIIANASEIEDIIDDSNIEAVELNQKISLLGDIVPESIIKIKADRLWDYTKGNGVKIAILDSGISQHDDLKTAGGVSFVSEDYSDTLGHGTQVAGVVSALLNGQGIVGAAPEADIYSVKISNEKEGNLSSAALGLEWAIDNNMSIVVMSFGFSVYSQIFKDLVEEAYSNGIIMVSAQGNDGIAEAQYPAKYERVIAVGSVNSDNVKAPFSNYGPDLELVAPGTNINTTTIGNSYAIAEGTSYSAAHVAGVAALIKSYNNSLTNVEIRNKLRNDALDLGDNGWDSFYGYGMVQASLDTFNFTPHNDSYFYQIYNVTWYNTPLEENLFWFESYGHIDDVDFNPGIYLVNITRLNATEKYHYNVTENGSIFLLDVLKLVSDDGFSADGTSSNDGITWVGKKLDMKLEGNYPFVIDGECFEEWDGSFHHPFDYCFFPSSSKKNSCDSGFSVIECGHPNAKKCETGSTMQTFHSFVDTSYAHSGDIFANIFVKCSSSDRYREEPQSTKQYWVIDKRRGKCLNEKEWVIEGHYGSGNWKELTPHWTCQANTICKDTIEYTSESAYIDPCKFKCSIPDGSSLDCDCNSNVDCPADYYCNQVSGPDACKKIDYKNECSNYNDYFCENNWVKKCINNRKYWEKQKVESCSGKYKYCDEQVVDGTGKCSKYANHLDIWVDYADTGVAVNKQPGDKLKLNIFSEQNATLKIVYNKDVFDGDCFTYQIVKPGINTCNLTVKVDIGNATEEIKVENKPTKVNIILNPELLIITDSEKLAQEYNQEPNAVKAVLKQAYTNAKDKGVVYDLRWYKKELGVNNPFASFFRYNEKIAKPSMTNNSYSIEVSNFIKEKCNDCEDVMIVGDDFVVPSYRRDIPTLERKWIFWTEKDIKNIYTDIPYTNKQTLEFSNYYEMFKKDGKYQGKDVLFILPNSITEEQRTQIERLKKAFDDKNYSLDYAEWKSQDIYCVDERWFSKVRGQTLIIIGTEENNNAFKCMPFVGGDVNRDTAFMQPNVWDNKEYALVINTDNPKIIGALADMVETGEITKLKSESAYFFKVGVQYASYAALGVGVGSMILFTGGTAAPALLISAGAILDTIADSGDVADTCVVNNEGNMWCGGTIALAAVPYVPSKPVKNVIKKFGGDAANNQLKKLLEPFDDLIKKYFKKLRKIFGNIAFENAIKTVGDNVNLAKGTDNLVKESGKSAEEALENFKRGFSNDQRGKTHALKTIIKFGKYSDEFFEANGLVRHSDTNKRIFRADNRHPKDIFIDKDAGFKAKGDSLDYKSYVEKPEIPSRFIGASETPEGAFEAAITTGNVGRGGSSWAYVIDPRAGNYVDDLKTLPNPSQQRKLESAVVAIDEISSDDVVGAVIIKNLGEGVGKIVETIPNPNYAGKLNLNNIDYNGG